MFRLDWLEFEKCSNFYDVIVTSDILKLGCPYDLFYKIVRRFLRVGGCSVMVMPERKE